ncbi:stretch-activated Ca2+-permeable channel component-domain-containing protein [Apodospora peruviana]|uniref:Stretch-activated Ca2+-permeable channel component-domain-containing protein n=1 Tax=Apodospora peruviana TaxID=516989 RepID=A0AAE0MB92_9PEZI|nr:stretch-activated Ca2+-permeable channel component-domain-containing protein [Apodospora peruviana]
MQLSPLQSRLAASVIATCLLIALYFTLFSPHFALATDLKQTLPILLDDPDSGVDLEYSVDASVRTSLDRSYEPEFAAFDRSIIGRAPAGVTSLANNVEADMNVIAGMTQVFAFEAPGAVERDRDASRLELREESDVIQDGESDNALEFSAVERRQSSRTIYISANTCEQPQPRDLSKTQPDPPQLTLYVSTDPSNEQPGPNAKSSSQVLFAFTEGAVMYNLTTDNVVYIGVHAPNVSTEYMGQYNVHIAASTDMFFHTFNIEEDADLIWVDSDSQGALLITHDLTQSSDPALQQRIMSSQPYVMFAHNKEDRSINGLKYSYCGLQNNAQIAAIKNGQFASMVRMGMTKRPPGNLPKEQFYFSGLNSSADYVGILAQEGNGTESGNGRPGGGGHVFRATSFSTKSDNGNCAIILNLTFCDQVAYSVPSNPENFGDATKLAEFYDKYAASVYSNFEKALAQVPCEAPMTQRYSLVRNCSDCSAAYKEWLCTVTIPRCEDFSNPAPYLHARALSQPFPNGTMLDRATLDQFPTTSAFNSSRNPLIDEFVKPGPYKEVLPCDDVCYNLVQSCPSSLEFNCPRPGGPGFESSYSVRKDGEQNGELTCNYMGSAHVFSGSTRQEVRWWGVLVSLGTVLTMIAVL